MTVREPGGRLISIRWGWRIGWAGNHDDSNRISGAIDQLLCFQLIGALVGNCNVDSPLTGGIGVAVTDKGLGYVIFGDLHLGVPFGGAGYLEEFLRENFGRNALLIDLDWRCDRRGVTRRRGRRAHGLLGDHFDPARAVLVDLILALAHGIGHRHERQEQRDNQEPTSHGQDQQTTAIGPGEGKTLPLLWAG